ncbi:MAG: thiamine pyrophosphate-dependent enzyme [Candidatus Liptonbacteria bacterium]
MDNHTSNLGSIPGLSQKFPKEKTLAVFRKMCISQCFEYRVKKAYDEKHIRMPIYLSAGQEAVAAALSESFLKPYIFAQHRAHDLYLAYGGSPQALVDELLHKPTGCAGGMGGSASIHSPEIGMFGHSGLLGDQVPIATGFAQGSGKKTLSIMGDGAAEEDYVLASLGYAAHRKLPVLFVCIDNELSVLTRVDVRRSWRTVDVAKGFGLPAVDVTDDPWLIMHHVQNLEGNLPAFMNVHVVRHLWHAGTGKDSEPEWNRFDLVKNEIIRLGYGKEAAEIESKAREEVDDWWNSALPSLNKAQ